MHSQDLLMFAHSYAKQEEDISSLKFCYDVFLNYTEHGGEPTKYADGSIAMNAEKATEQLKEAIERVLRYPPRPK